jgi:acetylornithine/N-succinyldiaminopimelate aminotransferase
LLAKEKLNIFDPGDQGGTYTGQPLAMAVGIAVLEEILNKNLVEHSQKMGEFIKSQLAALSKQYEICNIRGKGLLIAFDLLQTEGTDLVNNCLKKGLLINSPKKMSIRLMPPLIVTKNEIREMLLILQQYLKKT